MDPTIKPPGASPQPEVNPQTNPIKQHTPHLWIKIFLILFLVILTGAGVVLVFLTRSNKTVIPAALQQSSAIQISSSPSSQEFNLQSKVLATFTAQTKDFNVSNNCDYSPTGFSVACIKNYFIGSTLKQSVLLNGVEGKQYDSITDLVFSPDGKTLGYIASQGKTMFAVINNKEEKPYEYATHLVFSPDSQHFAYVIGKGSYTLGTSPFTYSAYKNMIVVEDEKEGRAYGGTVTRNSYQYIPVFSPDSQKVMFSAFTDQESAIVINDQEIIKDSPKIQFVNIRFSGDGTKISAVIWDPTDITGGEGQKIELIDLSGNILATYNYRALVYASVGDFQTISSDGSKLAYVVSTGNISQSLYLNDQEVAKSDNGVWNPAISPDGSKLVYTLLPYAGKVDITNNNSSPVAHITLNNKEIGTYRTFDSRVSHFIFSKNGKYLAYLIGPSGNPNSPTVDSNLVVISDTQTCNMIISGKLYTQNYEKLSTTAELQDPIFSPDEEHIGFGSTLNGNLQWNVGKIDMENCKLTQ